MVRLEEFQTLVRPKGMDLFKHIKYNNMDGTLRDLISHLKFKSRYKIYYEKLDPTLVFYLNDMTSKNVREFHQDNFLGFRNFSDSLLVNKLLFNEDDLQTKMELGGYTVGSKETL